jgi:hypothetical protein
LNRIDFDFKTKVYSIQEILFILFNDY